MKEKELVFFEIRVPQENSYTVEQAQTLLNNLSFWQRRFLFFKRPVPLSLEIACLDQKIHFFAVLPSSQGAFFQSQLLAQYQCLPVSIKIGKR